MKPRDPAKKERRQASGNIIDIIGIIRPIMRVEKCFAVHRFRIVGEELRPAGLKMKTIGVIFTAIYAITFFVSTDFPTSIGSIENYRVVDELPQLLLLIGYARLTNMTSFFLSDVNIRIFTSLARIDKILRLQTDGCYYAKSRKNTVKLVVSVFLYNCVFSIVEFATYFQPKDVFRMKHTLVWTCGLLHDLEIIMFCKLLFIVKDRLELINHHFNKIIRENYKKKTKIFVVSEENQLLFIRRIKQDDLATAYKAIGETCQSINTVFNSHIFMIILFAFSYMLLTICITIHNWKTTQDVSGTLMKLLILSANSMFSITTVTFSCDALLSSRKQTCKILNEIVMDYRQSQDVRNRAKSFLELVNAWPLRNYVYNMFSVDLTLLINYVRVATTYLIIIIQISHFV